MKIFIAPNVSTPKVLLQYQDAVAELKRLKISVVSAMDIRKTGYEGLTFGDFDALIIDGGSQDSDTGYLLAIALAHKKPILYMLQKGSLIDGSIEALTKNAEIKKLIKIVFYTDDSYSKKIKQFLQYLDDSIGREVFNIKYTLRLSPRLDRYVTWKAAKKGKNKADFLRDIASKKLEEDDEYRLRLQ